MNTKICPICKNPIPASAPGGYCPACILRDADEPAPAGRAAPPLAEIASAFPQLEIEKVIGQGGMGFVYKARQPSLDRTVALKILAPELGRDPAFSERFAREARVLGKLNHPNIVTVFESGESGGFFYLIMELVDGVNLRQAMRAGRFTPEQALAIVPGICDALQAAHAQGVWHRDIKPENILLDARGGVKIADFGIARIVGDPQRDFTLTATGAALGSAAYMAPEQHEKPHDVDHRADIYSLGVVIYEMLTGELPLGRFPAPSQRAAVNARIDEIVFRTLEKERELRQQSAEEVKTNVTDAASTAGIRTPALTDEEPASITQWSLGLALAGLVLFIASASLTHGSTQEVLLTFAILVFVLGFIGGCIALSKMVHGRISRGWRGGVRTLVWSPVAIAALFILALIIYMVPARNRQQDLVRRAERERAMLAKAKAKAAEVESWSYTLRHLDAAKLDAQTKAKPQAGVATKVEAGVVTLTGPRETVRPLATMLRVLDQPEVKNPLELPLLNMPPDFFTRLAIPALMSGTEFKDTQFEPAFFETLKRENITAPQLARALSAHVLELEKATFVNTGTPFESITQTPGASTYYDATIPCADQPDKPLTIRIRRTTQTMGTKPDIAGFAPWLIEEAKQQSKEPFPNAKNSKSQSVTEDAAQLAATKGRRWKSGALDLVAKDGSSLRLVLVMEFDAAPSSEAENPPDARVKLSTESAPADPPPTALGVPIEVNVAMGDQDFRDARLTEKDGVRTIKITRSLPAVPGQSDRTRQLRENRWSNTFTYELTADTLTLRGFPAEGGDWGVSAFTTPEREVTFQLQK